VSSRKGKNQFEKKSFRKKLIVKLIGGVSDLIGLDALSGTKFHRDFSKAGRVAQPHEYLVPLEHKGDDEAKIIADLVETFVDDTTDNDDLPCGAALDGDDLKVGFQDPHWGHTTGHLFGKLMIDPSAIEFPDLRVALFEKEGTYDVYCRPNFLYDSGLPIAINRLSLKLKMPVSVPNEYAESGVAQVLDLLLSEGLPIRDPDLPNDVPWEADGQGFFFRDARQLLMANEMKDGLLSLTSVISDEQDRRTAAHWKKHIFDANTDMLYRAPQTRLPWHRRHYFSAGPYALGKGAMKFALVPEDRSLGTAIDIFAEPKIDAHPSDASYHPSKEHAKTFNVLAEDNTEIRFKLMVQIATEQAIPSLPGDHHPAKCVMAAEYTDIAWDVKHAPFKEVGTLVLKPHQVPATDASSRWHAMPFNAWNTFRAMRPLGQLFRARRVVHSAHWKARLNHSFKDDDPGRPMARCPFSGT